MDKLMITGNGPLHGEVSVSGAKNAALPALTASILCSESLDLSNLPQVQDVATMSRLLSGLGMHVSRRTNGITIDGSSLAHGEAPYELVKAMRASILVLGPLVARLGYGRVSLPGGCAIGARPVDLHLQALRDMGAEVEVKDDYVEARAQRLQGATIHFPIVTVTGTENIMMAASLASGTTVLHNAAREPEVVDLAELLIGMGARIEGQGTHTITIHGVERLHAYHHRIIPDRIEAGTWLCAAAITGGHVTVKDLRSDHLTAFLDAMSRAGLAFNTWKDTIEILPNCSLIGTDITTEPHPDYPTDLQAQFMAVMTKAAGRSVIRENIFENRFMHVAELNKMGANIEVHGNQAKVPGNALLEGAIVKATDLRASASLVIAALAARGHTIIERIYHLDRGYDNLEGKLLALGGSVRRLQNIPSAPPATPVNTRLTKVEVA